jgi:DNA polymerase III alpha subunit (gram-positive type)
MVSGVVEFADAGSGVPVRPHGSTDESGGREIDRVTFAVVDVETSGLSARHSRVLQVAVVTATADGTVLHRWSSYVRPRWRWLFRLGPKRIHRIDRSTLRRAPSLAEVMSQFTRAIEGSVLTAHNLKFDRSFLVASAHRSGHHWSPDRELCTLELSRSLDPERQYSHGLAGLCRKYDIPLTRHHDALADAEATVALLPHLFAASGVRTVAEFAQFVPS